MGRQLVSMHHFEGGGRQSADRLVQPSNQAIFDMPDSPEGALEKRLRIYLPELLKRCDCPLRKNDQRLEKYYYFLSKYMLMYQINTPIRQAIFFAQVIVESGGFENASEVLKYKDFDNMIYAKDKETKNYIKDNPDTEEIEKTKYNMERFLQLKTDYNGNYRIYKATLDSYYRVTSESDKNSILEGIQTINSIPKHEKYNFLKALITMYENYEMDKKSFISKYSYNGFHGRGLKQLTWYVNYRAFQQEVAKTKNSLNNPNPFNFNDNTKKYVYDISTSKWRLPKTQKESSFYLFPDNNNYEMAELIITPEYAVWSACWFFYTNCIKDKNCVDTCNVREVSIIVNGGENGIDKRLKISRIALQLLIDLQKTYTNRYVLQSTTLSYDIGMSDEDIKLKMLNIGN